MERRQDEDDASAMAPRPCQLGPQQRELTAPGLQVLPAEAVALRGRPLVAREPAAAIRAVRRRGEAKVVGHPPLGVTRPDAVAHDTLEAATHEGPGVEKIAVDSTSRAEGVRECGAYRRARTAPADVQRTPLLALDRPLLGELERRHELHDRVHGRRELFLKQQPFRGGLRGRAEIPCGDAQAARIDAEHADAIAEHRDLRPRARVAGPDDGAEPRRLGGGVTRHAREEAHGKCCTEGERSEDQERTAHGLKGEGRRKKGEGGPEHLRMKYEG